MDLIRYREEAASGRAISELVPILAEEVKLLSRNHLAGGKRSDMMALTCELETLRAFVRNAEPKSDEDNAWLFGLMKVAELIEHLHRAPQQKKWTAFLLRAARLIGVSTSNLQIQKITALLRAINERGQVYKQLSYEIEHEDEDDTFVIKLLSETTDYIRQLNNSVRVMQSIALILFFDDLQYNTKLCCLYFGMLPEDFIIANEKLVKLWIAEGFIEEKYGGETMEQVAEEYLNEFVCACFVIEHGGFSHVNDLVFDLARHMCDKFNFPRYLSISRQESSFPRYLSISDLLQDRLQGSVQNTSNVFWRNLQLSFSSSDVVVDFVRQWSYSSNRCISDDHVDTVSRCSSSSNR